VAGKKIGDAFVRVRPDSSGFRNEFKADAEGAGGVAGSGFASSMLKVVGGLFAGAKIIDFFKGTIERATTAAQLGRLTDAVIKSTGGAAHVSAANVDTLAKSLANLSGVDDEVIHSSENVLLTFTNVRNAVGKGNDIFNQAQGAILNMSAALKEDLQSATIQVGKALQDPVKGVTALQRVGVILSAQQKQQIKDFVASGNVMAAQKVILAELTREFGGAAAAAATPAEKAKVAWDRFKEGIGNQLLPVVTALIGLFTGRLLPAIEGPVSKIIPLIQGLVAAFMSGFTSGQKTVGGVAGAFQSLGIIAQFLWQILVHNVLPAALTLWHYLSNVLGQLVPLVNELAKFVQWLAAGSNGAKVVVAVLLALVAAFVAYKVILTTLAIWQKIVTAAQWLWNAALDANPIGLIIIAIAALVVAFIYLWTHSAGFRDFWKGLWADIKGAALAVANWFTVTLPGFFATAWSKITGFFSTGYNTVVGFFRNLPGNILAALGNLGNLLLSAGQSIVTGLWNGISSMGGWLWNKITSFVSDNIIAPVRNFLGWHSPSTLFAQAGRDTVRGYVLGLRAESRGVMAILTAALSPSGLGVASPQAAPAASQGGGSVNHFHIGNQDPVTLAKIVTREQAWTTGV
jgi:phage-related protein